MAIGLSAFIVVFFAILCIVAADRRRKIRQIRLQAPNQNILHAANVAIQRNPQVYSYYQTNLASPPQPPTPNNQFNYNQNYNSPQLPQLPSSYNNSNIKNDLPTYDSLKFAQPNPFQQN